MQSLNDQPGQEGNPGGLPPGGPEPFAPPPPPPPGAASPSSQSYSDPAAGYGGTPPSGTGRSSVQDERMWGALMHLSGIIVTIIGSVTALPAFGFLGPLILWLIKRNESRFLDDQGREALNFNLTVGLAMLLCVPLWIVFGLGILLQVLIGIAALVLTVMAAIRANNGEWYRYPMTIRFVK